MLLGGDTLGAERWLATKRGLVSVELRGGSGLFSDELCSGLCLNLVDEERLNSEVGFHCVVFVCGLVVG